MIEIGIDVQISLIGQQSAVVILQLSKEARITSIDIGNEGSAFVEVLVGRSSTSPSTTNDDYRVGYVLYT